MGRFKWIATVLTFTACTWIEILSIIARAVSGRTQVAIDLLQLHHLGIESIYVGALAAAFENIVELQRHIM